MRVGRRKIIGVFLTAFLVTLFSVLFIYTGLALHVVTITTSNVTGTSFNILEDNNSAFFNFTINNTDTPTTANITTVNITLPAGFTLIANTNFTNAIGANVSLNNTAISWLNTTLGVVTNNSFRYFSFNATAATPGFYNFTIITVNSTGNFTNNTISVRVNDTTKPDTFDYASPGDNNGANVSRTNILVNTTVTDNGVVGVINVTLYNATLSIINSSISGQGVASFFVNFTGLSDGLYYVNGTVNDTYNNVNGTISNRTVRVDTTSPTVSTFTASSTGQTSITFNLGGTDAGSGVSSCSISSSSGGSATDNQVTGLSCGTNYDVTAQCTDYAGNQGTSTDDFTTAACSSSGGSSSSSGSGSGSTATWTNTYPDDATDLSMHTGGVTRVLSAHWRIRVKIASETHYVGITSLSTTGATVEVSSTPQSKTMTIGETSKFDANGDGFYDMKVTLVSIANSQANLKVEYLHEEVSPSGTTTQGTTTSGTTTSVTPTSEAPSQWNAKRIGVIILIIIIVAVAGYLLMRQKSKKKARRGY